MKFWHNSQAVLGNENLHNTMLPQHASENGITVPSNNVLSIPIYDTHQYAPGLFLFHKIACGSVHFLLKETLAGAGKRKSNCTKSGSVVVTDENMHATLRKGR